MRRVVITGAGTVNALAHDVPGTQAALLRGDCGIGPLALRDLDRCRCGSARRCATGRGPRA